MSPDVIIGQEFISASAVIRFRNLLNTAPNSPGDWQAAPFINGPDTDNALFYRTSAIELLGVTIIAEGGPAPTTTRVTWRATTCSSPGTKHRQRSSRATAAT